MELAILTGWWKEMGYYGTKTVWFCHLTLLTKKQWYMSSITHLWEGFRTYKRIASNFYWVGMKKDIQDYIRCCDTCQRNKSDTLTPIQERSHIVAWGGRGPCKNFFFPLAYEEKIIRPSQHFTARPPTHFSQIFPALNQKLVTPSN